MFSQEEAQYALYAQAAFGVVPATGILIPGEAAFNATHTRNKLENPQLFADGRKRKFALGNHATEASGSLVPNLSFIGHLLRAAAGAPTTTGVGAPYSHAYVPEVGPPLYHLIEKGIVGQGLWRRYLDMVLASLSMDLPVEGICTASTSWAGSGDMQKNAAAIDAAAAEIMGDPGEYANIALTMDAVATTDITSLSVNFERSVVWKRAHNGNGKATAARIGAIGVSGTIEAYFESEAMAAKAEAKTLGEIKATLSNGADSLETLLPEIQLEIADWQRTDDGIMITFNYDSVYAGNVDAPVKWTLINAVASYA